jgi:uncharacterized protein (TIGR02679 family)
LYTRFGIKPDDISNSTTVFGIRFFSKDGGVHKAYDSFNHEQEAHVVTLSNLERITGAAAQGNTVYVFENQMVFSHMCESLSGLPVSMMCTSGQMKTASLMLIDLLCEAGCRLYYSGDFDPEGLGIADRLIARHPRVIFPWRLAKTDYERCISAETISHDRIRKLDKIADERLHEVVHALRIEKKAGYQERLIHDLLGDIRRKSTHPFNILQS